MKDFTISVTEKILSYNAKILRNKSTQKPTYIKDGQQYYELRYLDSRNYDHYFKNNNRFYNYQRTRQISEKSDNGEHYQISNRCDQYHRNSDTKQASENIKSKISCRINSNKSNTDRHQCENQHDRNNNAKNLKSKSTCEDNNNLKCRSPHHHSGPCPGKLNSKTSLLDQKQERTVFEPEENLEPEPVQRAYIEKHYQLMHPDWRWIPHVPLYGWTPHHEQNIRRLYDEMAENRITSMYYKDAKEYDESANLYRSLKKSNHFLKKPTVSTLEEVFALIKKTIQHDDRYTRHRRTPFTKYRPEDNGYEADVEETMI